MEKQSILWKQLFKGLARVTPGLFIRLIGLLFTLAILFYLVMMAGLLISGNDTARSVTGLDEPVTYLDLWKIVGWVLLFRLYDWLKNFTMLDVKYGLLQIKLALRGQQMDIKTSYKIEQVKAEEGV